MRVIHITILPGLGTRVALTFHCELGSFLYVIMPQNSLHNKGIWLLAYLEGRFQTGNEAFLGIES